MMYDFYKLFKPTSKDWDGRDERYKRFCERNGYRYVPLERIPLYEEKTLPDGTMIRERVK